MIMNYEIILLLQFHKFLVFILTRLVWQHWFAVNGTKITVIARRRRRNEIENLDYYLWRLKERMLKTRVEVK